MRASPARFARAFEHSPAAIDCLLLAVITGAVAALYVPRLGFYSDDWVFFSLLERSPDQSFAGLLETLYAGDVVIRQRPVQIAYLAGMYRLFDLQPLPYHVLNAVVLAAAVLLLYFVVRTLTQNRMFGFAVAAVYATMPNFSTDRFWVAAHQATLSVALMLAAASLALVSMRARGIRSVGLAVLSAGAVVLSGLAYEVALPLLVLLWGLMLLRELRTDRSRRPRLGGVGTVISLQALALFGVLLFKATVSVRVGTDQPLADHLATVVVGALRVNFGVYGVGLPYVGGWVITHAGNVAVLATSALVGLITAGYVRLLARRDPLSVRTAGRYVGAGAVTFALGYAVFLVPTAVSFSSTSLGNRIGIAASIGAACVLVGAVALAAHFARRVASNSLITGGLVGAIAACGVLATGTLGGYWANAFRTQEQLVADLRSDLPVLPPDSVVIVDGVCAEEGGAYVFTGDRDITGILQIAYRTNRVRGSGVTNPPLVGEKGVTLFTYGSPDTFPYGPRLLVYDAARRRAARLTSPRRAREYFRTSSFDPRRDCPPGFAWGLN